MSLRDVIVVAEAEVPVTTSPAPSSHGHVPVASRLDDDRVASARLRRARRRAGVRLVQVT